MQAVKRDRWGCGNRYVGTTPTRDLSGPEMITNSTQQSMDPGTPPNRPSLLAPQPSCATSQRTRRWARRGHALCRKDEIALVLPVRIVDHHHEFATRKSIGSFLHTRPLLACCHGCAMRCRPRPAPHHALFALLGCSVAYFASSKQSAVSQPQSRVWEESLRITQGSEPNQQNVHFARVSVPLFMRCARCS